MSNHHHKMFFYNFSATQIVYMFLFYMCISIVSFMGCKNTIEVQKEFHKQGTQAGEKQTIIINEIPYTFCWCPPGQYTMGENPQNYHPVGQLGWGDVILTQGFWMLESEITQAMWINIMENNPSEFKSGLLRNRLQHPVERVSWDDCQTFITKLNEMSLLPSGYLFSLPTDAQWEYAACAGKKPFTLEEEKNLDSIAWRGGKSWWMQGGGPSNLYTTQRVKTKNPNDWGLYDMLGNVFETCLDKFFDDKYIYSSIPQKDLFNEHDPTKLEDVVIRGGSVFSGGVCVRSRGGVSPRVGNRVCGFRIVIKQPQPSVFSRTIPTDYEWVIDPRGRKEFRLRGKYVHSDERFVEVQVSTGDIVKLEKNSLEFYNKNYIRDEERKNKKRAKSEFPDETEFSSASEESQTSPIREDESKDELIEETPAPSGKSSESADMKNVRIGDRRDEFLFVADAATMHWSVNSETSRSHNSNSFPTTSVFNDARLPAARTGNKEETLFFSEESTNQLFYTYQAQDVSRLCDFVELHDLDAKINRLYKVPLPAKIEGIVPQKELLFGRCRHVEHVGFLNVIAFLRMSNHEQLEPAFIFDPYRQPFPRKDAISSQFWSVINSKTVEQVIAINSSLLLTQGEGMLTLWDIDKLRSKYSIVCKSQTTDVSDDGKWLAVPVTEYAKSRGIEIREVLSGKVRGVLGPRESGIIKCCFSPSGRELAVLYRDELVVYSLKYGTISCEIPCPDATLSENHLIWVGDDRIMNNGILYDLNAQMAVCHYLTLDSRTNVMQYHQGRLWIIFRSPEGFKLINEKLPHEEIEQAFQKLNLKQTFDYYPDIPLKLIVVVGMDTTEKTHPTLLEEWQEHLKTRGFKVAKESSVHLSVAIGRAPRKEIFKQFGRVTPKAVESDYYLQYTQLFKNAKQVWSNQCVHHEQNWETRLMARYGPDAPELKNEVYIPYIDDLRIPRYIQKDQEVPTAAPIQAMFDAEGVKIVSP
ncbi:MAG: SUMF1/EgtB/PvdO family nonheme iron enzyme [Planctomycetia bacterium]|nr:SUMF1/EgtB/PvdO family nonheme iron enzyme [Planctomycetia bacterium]